MKILLVGINFSPEPTGIGPYMRAYADALQAAGHEVTVITGLPHYPQWRVSDPGAADYPYRVIRCPHFVPATLSSIGRLRYEATFAMAVNRRLSRLGPFDAIVAVIPSLASAAVAVEWAGRRGTPLLVVIQDIVTSGARLAGPSGIVLGVFGRLLEYFVLRRAAGIAAISAGMRPALIRRGARVSRIAITPNWPLRLSTQLDASVARARSSYPSNQLICVHAGNMGAKQGLDVLVNAARLAQDRGARVRFVLVGDGNQRAILQEMSRGLTHIEFRPVLSPADYDAALAGADVLLLTQRVSVRDMALPSKLTSYLGVGKPIVASVSADSVTAAELSRSGGAIVVPAGDAKALLEAILEVQSNTHLRARLSEQGRSYYDTELDPVLLRQRFVNFVELAGSPRQVASRV